jgi:hypothetical protein
MHGSTQFINGEYVPRSDEELHRHVMWARSTVGESQSADYPALTNIDLGTLRPLGQAYQKSSAMARWYRREALPNDTELEEAAVFFAGLLRKLYDAGDLGRAPDSPPPEVAACEYAIEHIARPGADTRKNKGQGFGLNAEERRTIEFHAMTKAEAHLRKEGFELRDVSRTHSYDFIATKGDVKLIVEVKGTTSALGAIVLTANEVDAHLEHYPHNMLIVVHTIDLDRSLNNGVAFGGEIRILCPWELINENLRPLSYQYRLDDVT